MSQSFNLYQLQKIDTQLDRINTRLSEIERTLASDKDVKQADQNSKNKRTQLSSASKALQIIEESVQSKRIKIEQSESALYSGQVRNPKELQDLQAEITSLKKFLKDLEDQQLDAMIQFEEAEKQSQDSDQLLIKAQNLAMERNAALNSEYSLLLKEKEKLLIEKEAATGQIVEGNLSIYNHLRVQKNGIVVATIDEDSCSVCGSIINPAERQAARSPSKICYCQFCGRILYAG